MITDKEKFTPSTTIRCLMVFFVTAHLLSSEVNAQTVESQPSTSDEITLLDAMQASNQGYAETVVIPVLRKLATAALFLEGKSAVFVDSPTSETLNEFRAEFEHTTALRAMAASFDFGPIHSLGYAAAMDTRADVGGLEKLVSDSESDASRLRAAASNPWLQGFDAIDYLLNSTATTDTDLEVFTDSKRFYLQLLTTALRQTTQSLLDSWTTGVIDYPAYSTILFTAGSPENQSYLTVDSASEEILRGVVNSLDVVNNDYLAPVIDSEMQQLDANEVVKTLSLTRAALLGMMSSYVGRPISLNTPISQHTVQDGSGLGLWVDLYDSQLNQAITTQLITSITMIESYLEDSTVYEPAEQQVKVGEIHQSTQLLFETLQTALAQTTQVTAPVN